jgi:hypothetical protein
MNVRLLPLVLALTFGACASNPQRLPVRVSRCDAVAQPNGFTVSATVQNKSDKPISSLGVSVAFYHDFRYAQFSGTTHLRTELDPDQKRDITFDVTGPQVRENGRAMTCLVTHIGYLDGTSADLAPSQ